ncbi:MAG TPA: hypothetical protein VE442_13905 [Jatrophihabitans sp.]|nr:hypothetical protein [Jatrophihabitans sp.]
MTAACSGADGSPAPGNGSGSSTSSGCVVRAGARCPGPAPIDSALIGHMYIASRNQLTIFGAFQCGGRLQASESGKRVVVTYVASRVPPGGMACAKVKLSVGLDKALAGRTVVDGVTGKVLHVGVRANA